MLDDGAGRPVATKLADQFERRVRVVDIVVGQLLALQQRRRGHAGTLFAAGIERRCLVRVLAVAHDVDEPAAEGAVPWRLELEFPGKPSRDRCVIGSSPRESQRRKLAPQSQRNRAAMALQRLDHPAVVLGVGDGGDIGMVLGRRADHCRPADVDVLDNRRRIGAAGCCLFERVEVDHGQIDLGDLVHLHCGPVLLVVTDREQAAMHARMQRLDPAIHDFRKSGQVGNVANRKARRFKCRPGTAGRNQLHAEVGEITGEIHQPGLVGNRQKRAADLHQIRHRMVLGYDSHMEIPRKQPREPGGEDPLTQADGR